MTGVVSSHWAHESIRGKEVATCIVRMSNLPRNTFRLTARPNMVLAISALVPLYLLAPNVQKVCHSQHDDEPCHQEDTSAIERDTHQHRFRRLRTNKAQWSLSLKQRKGTIAKS